MNLDNQHVVVIIPKRLGDTLIATPSLAFLKHSFPSCQLDALCVTQLSATTLENNPAIDNLYIEPSEMFSQQLFQQADIIISLFTDPEYYGNHCTEFRDKFHLFPNQDEACHKAEQKLNFIQNIIQQSEIPSRLQHYQVYPSQKDKQHSQTLLEEAGFDFNQHIIIGIHLGCYGLSKHKLWKSRKKINAHHKFWGMQNYFSLAKQLIEKYPDIRFAVTGSKGEKHFIKKFCKKIPQAENFADQTTPLQLAALMPYFTAYLSSDTGAAHVAYAMDAETVVLFGRTSVTQFGPYPFTDNIHLLQAENTADIPVEQVFKELDSIITQCQATGTTRIESVPS